MDHAFSKAGAKVLLLFDMCKYFQEKMQKKHFFPVFLGVFPNRTA